MFLFPVLGKIWRSQGILKNLESQGILPVVGEFFHFLSLDECSSTSSVHCCFKVSFSQAMMRTSQELSRKDISQLSHSLPSSYATVFFCNRYKNGCFTDGNLYDIISYSEDNQSFPEICDGGVNDVRIGIFCF